ncbi:hypothetical protein MHU86_18242 [Fragilaria crotonensis]|nr:hypothetical protein MHU86_18242 [Fragilaria crotonensis]
MAFSVLLSVVDMPLHSAQTRTLESDRRAQREFMDQNSRALVKGRGTFRVAAFGSSNMWGAGLENRFDALPYLLSNEVDNYAMFSAGPNYPSVCTQTIVGDDDVYDVIFLEYWLKARQGLPQLALRLRERYPNAMIFFVKIWSPIHARRRGNDDGDWFFPDHPEADIIINEARKSVDGYNIRIPKKDTDKETLAFYLHFFNHQQAQLSSMGHAFLANMTTSTIKRKLAMERTSVVELVDSVGAGSWGRGDSCHMWYTDGGYNAEHSPTLVMRSFDLTKGKFALEVTAPGWLIVNNPFDDERTLYLSFLSTVEGYYPEATVSIGENGAPMMLVPVNPEDTRGAHNPRTLPVGKIPPGETKIYITPQGNTGNFFRLVGESLTNEVAVPIEYGFGPTFNN